MSCLSLPPALTLARTHFTFLDSSRDLRCHNPPFGLALQFKVADHPCLISFLSFPSLSSLSSVTISSTLSPLPAARPLVILVPIISSVVDSKGGVIKTPSAMCFPSTGMDDLAPVMSPLDRALGHLRRAKKELDELATDLSQIVLMGEQRLCHGHFSQRGQLQY